MNNSFSKLVLIVTMLASAVSLQAYDAVSPCWRGQAGTTFQSWGFLSANNPATPELTTNSFGVAQASMTIGSFGLGYRATRSFSTNAGWWELGNSGTMNITVPNAPGVPVASCKYIWVQVVQFIGGVYSSYSTVTIPGATYLGGQRVQVEVSPSMGGTFVDQTLWRVEPSPASDTIIITTPTTSGIIDQVLVDTISVGDGNTYVDDDYGAASDCTLVGWPNSVAPIDKAIGLRAFASLQTGVDRAPTNGIVNVAAGTYGAVNVNKPVTVVLGQTSASATVGGNFTLVAGATLAIDVNGLTPGTQHDQWVVNGVVNLGGATLSLNAITLATNSTVLLINNDGADPVVGTFAGLPEGATNLAGGQQFKISYVGGTGNDVVLTMVNHAPIPGAKMASTYQNLAAAMGVPKLLGVASDPDDDEISFVGPVALSAQGGTVVSNSADTIVYTPPLNFVGTDSFYYTISDGKALATGTVTVEVLPSTGLTFNMLPLVISNTFPFVQFAGVRGYSYDLQRSPDLTNWTTIATIFLPTNGIGIGSFHDTDAPSTNAFYRTHVP